MFYKCTSIKELYLSTFKYRYKVDFDKIFSGCPNKLIMKIKK